MKSFEFRTVSDADQYFKNNLGLGHIVHAPVGYAIELSSVSDENVVICSTSGEITPEGYKDGIITGFSYEKDIAEIIEIRRPAILSKPQMKVAYDKVKANKNAFLLLLLDGLSGTEEGVMSTLYFMEDRFKIVGGSAGDNLKFELCHIYIGQKKVENVGVFFNVKKRTALIKENLYIPTGDKLLITEADPISRVVKTIDNLPAAEAYARHLGVSVQNLQNHFMTNPLGKIYKNEIMIASPMKINPDKSITFYCQVMPNTFVHMLEPADTGKTVDATLNSLPFKPSFMYVVNCILRSLKFQNDKEWPLVDKKLSSVCHNTTGFVSYGEQFYNHHVNQTMVILAIE